MRFGVPATTAVPVQRVVQPQQAFGVQHLDALKALLSIDFNTHDGRLKQCLDAARVQLQNLTGLLLLPGQVTVSWSQLYDWEDLPWGPVTSEVLASNLDGTSPFTGSPAAGPVVLLSDEDFPRLTGNYPLGIKLIYTAGYDDETLPADLLQAALNLAANSFDKDDRDWRSTAFAYRRGSFIQ